jgi:hypothetical protein
VSHRRAIKVDAGLGLTHWAGIRDQKIISPFRLFPDTDDALVMVKLHV